MKIGDRVKVIPTEGIGYIIDMGTDSLGKWYRTDVDGTREEHELELLTNKTKNMKIDVRSKESVFITINEVTYYIDDSTNEQIVEVDNGEYIINYVPDTYAEGGEIMTKNNSV